MLKLLLTTQPFADYCETWTEPPDGWGGLGPHEVAVELLDHPDVDKDIALYAPADAEGPVPVLVFAHGWLADSHDRYAFLFERLASNGFAVVFAPYSSDFDDSHASRYDELEAGVALAEAEWGPALDFSRVGYLGHSYGAGAVPELARRGMAHGWGDQGLLLFPMAPWYSFGGDYSTLPAHTVTVIQTYAQDEIVDPAIGRSDLWDRLPADSTRVWLEVADRDTESCRSPAGHLVPGTSGSHQWIRGRRAQRIDAHDVWSIARRIHASAAWSFGMTGESAYIAGLGQDPLDGAVRASSEPLLYEGRFQYPLEERCERSGGEALECLD